MILSGAHTLICYDRGLDITGCAVSLKTRKEHDLHQQMRGEARMRPGGGRLAVSLPCHQIATSLSFSAFPASIFLLRVLALWSCKGSEQHQQCGVDEGHGFYTHRRTEKERPSQVFPVFLF